MYEKSGNESNADTDLGKQMLLDIGVGVILRINMCFYLLRKFLYKIGFRFRQFSCRQPTGD